MPRYKIIKYIQAKTVKEALRKEQVAEIDEISKDEPEQKEVPNTHAIGFHIGNAYDELEDYPDHGI